MIDIKEIIKKEEKRQKEGVELIASENYVSKPVLDAVGSILIDKYSEGYCGKRYYKGNDFIDEIEDEAIRLAKNLFKAEHVNVQPYSGSPANLAVHLAFLNPGDNTMGMNLEAGGHLTHGFKASFSGKLFNAVQYGVNEYGYIDYNEVEKLAMLHNPKLIWAGASAYSRTIDFKKFSEIAKSVGAVLAADISHISGLVITGAHPNPFPHADIVTTTTHKTLRGPRGAIIMCKEEFAERIDKAVFPGLQGGPHNNTTAGIVVALQEASTDEFKEYVNQVLLNAKVLASELEKLGFRIISGGTDNHLMLIDLTPIDSNLSGELASEILESVNITVNKNAIPNDIRKPWDPSGIRIGTPAITSRGMKEGDMKTIATFIHEALINYNNDQNHNDLKNRVREFAIKFPIPGIE